MVKSLRESKAKLSELVDLASRGEDVLITVRGKVKARLTKAGAPDSPPGGPAWVRELRALHRAYGTTGSALSIEEILDEDRADRM